MAEPLATQPTTTPGNRLQRRIEEMWAERDLLIAQGIDPDEELDRLAEEIFGTPEATQVLLDYLRHTIEGPDPHAEGDADDDAW